MIVKVGLRTAQPICKTEKKAEAGAASGGGGPASRAEGKRESA